MAVYTANSPDKTLTIHKEGCRWIPREKLQSCGCGPTGKLGNQFWWCEQHFTLDQIDEFMNHRHWAVLMCDVCFKEGI
jgi:hypothetical protein